jgi:outer membrane receptor protein involved in Fe transport
MKTRQFALVLFGGITAISSAAIAGQPVHGRVSDAGTVAPVGGATVRIQGRPGHATSNKEGEFTLANVPPGTWTLEVSKPPFTATTDTVVVEGDHPPDPVELLLIGEVDTLKLVEPMKPHPTPPGGVEVIREEIQRIPGTRGDMLTAVQSLPGIANTGTFTPFSSGVIIRGSDPSDARILVDGFEIPLLYHFGAVQSIIPTEMIQGIQYAPGGFGTENGRASSGVIEVQSRPGTDKLGGFAELSFINGAVMLHGPIGDPSNHATFAVSFRRSVVDALVPAVLGKDSGLQFSVLPRYYDWQARADWQPRDRWHLSLFVFGTDDRTVFAMTPKSDTGDPLLSGNIGTRTDFNRAIASVAYQGERFKNRAAMSLDLTKFSFDMSTDRHLHLRNEGMSFRDEAQLILTPWLTLRGGAESITQLANLDEKMPRPQREGDPAAMSFTYDPIVARTMTATLPTVAGWASADVALGRRAALVGGLRYDGFLRNNAHVVQPRAELKVFAGKNTFRAAGGLYSRPPYWEDEITQTNLQPERAWQSSLGWERELLPGLTLQTTGFYTRRSNLIMFGGTTRETATGNDVYTNGGTGQTYGGELMLTARGPHHFGWVAYTLSRSTRQDGAGAATRLFDFDQTHNLVIVGSRRFGKDDHWQIGGRFQFTTGKPYTPVMGAHYMTDLGRYEPQWGAVNSQRMEPMHQLDLRLDRLWQFKDWRLSAYLDVQNVYSHAAVMDYRYNDDYTQKTSVKTLPILPSIGVRAEF